MFNIKAIYNGKEFQPKEPIPVNEEYEVTITFVAPLNRPENQREKGKITKVRNFWNKRSRLQRILLVGIMLTVLAGIGILVPVSSKATMVPVINAPIWDEAAHDRIIMRLEQEGVKVTVNSAGIIQVKDEATARRVRSILIREGLIPSDINPWAIFDRERWSITEFERNVLDDVESAIVVIAISEDSVFSSKKKPVTASVIISPKPESDIVQNSEKIEGIMEFLQNAIEGLKAENIIIVDHTGQNLNDSYNVIPGF